MSKKLQQQIGDLNELAAEQRKRDQCTASPAFETNVQLCREVWESNGKPTLLALQELSRTLRPDFEMAGRMDFGALAHSGVDRYKWLSPAKSLIDRALELFDRVPTQLEDALAKIGRMTPETESGNKHGCKLSDEILYEINAALGFPDELRTMHGRLKFLVEGILAARRRLTGALPAETEAAIALGGPNGD
jgi:hypothetical protein